MVGHGRPVEQFAARRERARERIGPLRAWRGRVTLCLAIVTTLAASARGEPGSWVGQPVRMRIAVDGVNSSLWSGTVRFENATLDKLQPLGLVADAATAIWLQGDTVHVAPPPAWDAPTPGVPVVDRQDAVDLTVLQADDARLVVAMQSRATGRKVTKEVALPDALRNEVVIPLDDQGSVLTIGRSPGTKLRITSRHDSLIFAPGEMLTFDVQPMMDEIKPGTSIDIDTQMSAARSSETLWSHHQRLLVPVEGASVATLHLPLPRKEGVYEIRVAILRPPGFNDWFLPGGLNRPLVERSFQVVVLSPDAEPPASNATWQSVLEIDPANPRWWEPLSQWTQIGRIPGVAPRPLGSQRAETELGRLGRFVRLPSTGDDGEPHWQAYPLPLGADSIGAPHLLEVEYPVDQPQHLALSILEADATGRVVPVGRDTGVFVEGLGHNDQAATHKHRIVFWPRTDSPLLLVSNQHPTAAARFGKLRVLKRSSRSIATQPWEANPPAGRLVAAYLSRPMVPETFGVSEGVDLATGESFDDLQTFYESAVRLADYSNYAGYNAAAVSVLADGSSVFPSQRLLSTPRYNTSRRIAASHDLPPIDALELQLRVFDRCSLALLPTLQFAAPLAELEALRRGTDPRSSGLELVGPSGLTWTETYGAEEGLAPYYNLLDDRVQQAMGNVVRELVDRYGHHPALAGLVVQLSAQGYATLPGLEWGLDDATMARFEQETGIQVPTHGADRFARRRTMLLGEHADAWRDWRTGRVTAFYRELAAIARSDGRSRRVVLTTEELFSLAELAERFRPRVSTKPRIDRAMLSLGIDQTQLAATPGLIICPTQYVESTEPLVDRALRIGMNEAFATLPSPAANGGVAAAAFYHPPLRLRMTSFDAKSPLPSTQQRIVQSAADAPRARRPYATALRDHDPLVVLDGGQLLPLGQEDATRSLRRLVARLPIDALPTVVRQQNVTVRSYEMDGQTLMVVVNECPWAADVELTLDVPVTTTGKLLTDQVGAPTGQPLATVAAGSRPWPLKIAPYDVQAIELATSGVRVASIEASVSEAGRRELTDHLKDISQRDLTTVELYPGLENPDFEPTVGGALSGWRLIGNPLQSDMELDAANPHNGQTSLHLRNTQRGGVASIESNVFTTPPTGQLMMTVWARGENLDPETELLLVFEADGAKTQYRNFSVLGGSRPDAIALGNAWRHWAFRRDDVPLDSRGRMRVKFELTGPGEVWIDSVQLYDLMFPLPLRFYDHARQERLKLVQLFYAAEGEESNDLLSACVERLEGYWPRFVAAYRPASQPRLAAAPPQPIVPQVQPPADADAGGGWWKFWQK